MPARNDRTLRLIGMWYSTKPARRSTHIVPLFLFITNHHPSLSLPRRPQTRKLIFLIISLVHLSMRTVSKCHPVGTTQSTRVAKTIRNKASSTRVHLIGAKRSSKVTYPDTPAQTSLASRIRVVVVVIVAIIVLVFDRRRRSVGSQRMTMMMAVTMTRRRTRTLYFRTQAQTQAQGRVRV
jgi:hypothetical protein